MNILHLFKKPQSKEALNIKIKERRKVYSEKLENIHKQADLMSSEQFNKELNKLDAYDSETGKLIEKLLKLK